jgi:hypothetical protein
MVSLQVLPSLQPIFLFKTWFFGIYLNFQQQKSLKISISPTLGIQILPNKFHKILLIKSFSTTPKGTFQFLRISQVQFNLIFDEKNIRYSKTFAAHVQTPWNHTHAPLLVKSFPKIPRIRPEASQFGGSHIYKTKQTTYLHK